MCNQLSFGCILPKSFIIPGRLRFMRPVCRYYVARSFQPGGLPLSSGRHCYVCLFSPGRGYWLRKRPCSRRQHCRPVWGKYKSRFSRSHSISGLTYDLRKLPQKKRVKGKESKKPSGIYVKKCIHIIPEGFLN